MTLYSSALLDAASTTVSETPVTGGLAGMLPTLVMMAAVIVLMYFMMIRPQRKKDKAVKDMLAALKVSDRVCTIGGIYGTIIGIKDDTITLAVGAQKAQMVVARWAIRSVEDAPLENSDALV